MAKSSQAIDTSLIVTLENLSVNTVADLNSMYSEIITKFNAMLETVTGHNHDTVTSAPVVMGVGGLTGLEYQRMLIMGGP